MDHTTSKCSLEFLLQENDETPKSTPPPLTTTPTNTTFSTTNQTQPVSDKLHQTSHPVTIPKLNNHHVNLTWIPSESDHSRSLPNHHEPTFVFYSHERDAKSSPFQHHFPHGLIQPRNRRRFHEVDRIFICNFKGCTKSYGALSHLNTHIVSKGHGKKRTPEEFEQPRDSSRDDRRA